MKWAWLLALLCAACGYDQQDETVAPPVDISAFRDHVQPVVAAGCASLDCHGEAERPLSLYSENGLRRAADLRGTPFTEAEVADNVLAMAGVDPTAQPAQNLVLLKPLATSARGMKHEGGDLWLSIGDPAYQCLLGWLSGSPGPTLADPCATAIE